MPPLKTHFICKNCKRLLPRDAFDQSGCLPKGRKAYRRKARCRECLKKADRKIDWHKKRGLKKPENPNPSGLCLCGCGEKTPICTHTRNKDGVVAGYPMKYVRGHAIALSGRKWIVEKETGCWIWQRSVNNRGRAQLAIWDSEIKKSIHYQAHRWLYEQHIDKIPNGYELDHLCCNPTCVNPEHMEPVTPKENKARTARRLRWAGLHWIKTGEVP